MIKHLLVDMDGVLCDFVHATLKLHNKDYIEEHWPKTVWHIEKVLGIETEDLWNTINSQGHEFWEGLTPYSWNEQLFSLVNDLGLEWSICSTPSRSGDSAKGKVLWMQKHLGSSFRDYHLCPEKFHLAKKGYVLLDDNDKNCELFEKHGGKSILFPQPWNNRYHLTGCRYETILNDLYKLHNYKPGFLETIINGLKGLKNGLLRL